MPDARNQLEDEIKEVVAAAEQLAPEAAFDEARHYLDHNEYALALDTVAAILARSGKRVDHELYATFLQLGSQMGMSDTFWSAIQPTG